MPETKRNNNLLSNKAKKHMKANELTEKLKRIVGTAWVRTDNLTRYYYGSDVITYFSQGSIYPENHPLVVVYPSSTKDIQGVIKLANKLNIPLYAIGGGTVLLIGSIPGKPDVSITFDFHRMQGIEIDKDRLIVRVQPGATGIQVSQLIRNFDLGYRPYFGGSPGTSHFVPYQLFTGQNKMAGYQDGMGIHCATGMEMVLPTGEIIRTGSMARPDSPGWPHGPGPALTYLPFYANAGYGIVTEMEFRFFSTPQKTSSLWLMFNTLNATVNGLYEVMRHEYGCGATIMGHGCWTHCLYSARHWQEGVHFLKATQNINLVGMSFRGTNHKIDFERKACSRIFEKHGGIPMPHWMVSILDGHETNAAGWQQNNSPRVLGTFNGKFDTGGLFVTGGAFDTLEKLEEHMEQGFKDYTDVVKKYPKFVNTPYPSFRLFTSCGQTYLAMGGHSNAAGEFICVIDYADRELLPFVGEISTRFSEMMQKLGLAPLGIGRDKRTWTECSAHFEMAKLIKKTLDPKNL
ncbi:MAG: FAD-binding oxidoreductase, partial [Deltaproteobacteria bacterium]|nr:FAD-binding oxidoreductase [Deltaproteobacteria bacterium]